MVNQYDTSEAYKRGWYDYENGQDHRNDYVAGTDEYFDYTEGYSDAELDLNDC